jgi:hypothetical protein
MSPSRKALQAVQTRIRTELSSLKETIVDDELESARSERLKHLADFESLRVKLMKGEAHRSSDVVDVMGESASNCRSRVLGMPSSLARILLGQKYVAEVERILTKHVNDALAQLKPYNAEDFTSRTKEFVLGLAPASREQEAEEE